MPPKLVRRLERELTSWRAEGAEGTLPPRDIRLRRLEALMAEKNSKYFFFSENSELLKCALLSTFGRDYFLSVVVCRRDYERTNDNNISTIVK